MCFKSCAHLMLFVAVAACAETDSTAPVGTRAQLAGPAYADQLLTADVGMQLRLRMRAMSDDSLSAAIEAGDNVAVVGFRIPGDNAGMSRDGRSLVGESLRRAFEDSIRMTASTVLYRFRNQPTVTIRVADLRKLLSLRHRPWIDFIEPRTKLGTSDNTVVVDCFDQYGYPTTGGDPSPDEVIPWQATKIRADSVWGSYTGYISGKRLVLLDDGVNEDDHTPFEYMPQGEKDLNTAVYAFYDTAVMAYEGTHGTLVYGAAGALQNNRGTVGIAPGADVEMDRIAHFLDNGFTYEIDWDNVAAAIDGEAEHAAVMSISWSMHTSSSSPPTGWTALITAIENGYRQHNVVFVASSGDSTHSNYYRWPAQLAEVVGVGGVSLNGDTAVFNDYAPGNIEIAAPAEQVVTICRGGKTGRASGTSLAAPVVAGAYMLLRQAHPSESNWQLRYRVNNTAAAMASTQRSGYGLINIKAAINTSIPNTPSVSIVGQSSVHPSISCTWSAVASGGSGSYSYSWFKNGSDLNEHTENLTTNNSGSPFTLVVSVSDGTPPAVADTLQVGIQSGAWCE